MTSAPEKESLLAAIRAVGQQVDSGVTRQLADRLEALAAEATPTERSAVFATTIPGEAKSQIARLAGAWRKSPEVHPQALAWALRSADGMDQWHRNASSTELVWTGPAPPGSTLRRTDQALLEVFNRARQSLLVICFTVYKVPVLQRALIEALKRGVSVRLVFETSEDSKGKFDGDPIAALDKELVDSSQLFTWPYEKRPQAKSAEGKSPSWGVLHAKCALADQDLLFVSSANLTGAAIALNIEMGVLIDGGSLPKQVSEHFADLVQYGVLVAKSI